MFTNQGDATYRQQRTVRAVSSLIQGTTREIVTWCEYYSLIKEHHTLVMTVGPKIGEDAIMLDHYRTGEYTVKPVDACLL